MQKAAAKNINKIKYIMSAYCCSQTVAFMELINTMFVFAFFHLKYPDDRLHCLKCAVTHQNRRCIPQCTAVDFPSDCYFCSINTVFMHEKLYRTEHAITKISCTTKKIPICIDSNICICSYMILTQLENKIRIFV